MPLSKITYLVPKVQRGGTFCEQRGAGGAMQAKQGLAKPLTLGSLALLTISLPHHYSLVSKGTEPGCQS